MKYSKVNDEGKEVLGDITYSDMPKQYIHTQNNAISLWTVEHNIGGYPEVTCKNENGDVIIGDLIHVNENILTIEFKIEISGKAILTV